MDAFKSYMSKVRAETELKESTAVFVNAALNGQKVINFKKNKENSRLKRIRVAVASLAACAVLAIGGYIFYSTPVSYVSVDINPSIELGINAFGVVVTSEGYNEDGKIILKETKLTHMALRKAIGLLLEEASEQGYIAEDGSSVIAVTSESGSEETAAELQEESEEAVNVTLEVKNLNAIVYADCSDLGLRTEAKELGISPGKYKLIAVLKALDPELDVEQYRDMKITDIIVEVSLQLKNSSETGDETGGETGDEESETGDEIGDVTGNETGKAKGLDKKIEKALEKIAKAAEKVEKTRGNSGKNKNDDPSYEQEQNQNGAYENPGEEQEQNQNGSANGNGNGKNNENNGNSNSSDKSNGSANGNGNGKDKDKSGNANGSANGNGRNRGEEDAEDAEDEEDAD